ncbi:energy-coupling factor transporter ATPase [Candidatus Xianfuyuplasma coldseepsis]|uniref:Energy-coupling factor transporter ATP-binding protein EcfA2 n=1 Tax=Candidatus Xianfuyuplasma coldseepsis TaxID=2782163 RepID=A0A7L7KSH2_9MOLU|nr:energy-coupling factor transporter ATPase [Xianfuyuplasma coldseepsis]QMS85212.1 energy-coupling factor transporter ATPase [Xianfuyuplasma coldseepsis]
MAIKFEQVGYHYRGADGSIFEAIKEINLEIDETGEFITLIGETGSGKSTLVQHMNALIRPSVGEVTVYGVKIYKDVKKKDKNVKLNPLRQKVGLVFQFPEYQLFEETVQRDIIFGPKNFGVSEEESIKRAHKVIKDVGLDPSYLSRSPFNLSGGEKKRVSIAGILAMEPDILVLDEPTSGLDPKGRDDLLELFQTIHKELNKTVLIITHDMNTVYKYASRVLVMNQGHLVYDGDPVTLFSQGDLEAWNLDKPDLLELCQQLETLLDITIDPLPKSVDDLALMIKGVPHE